MNPENFAAPGVPGPYPAPSANVGGPAVPGPFAPLPAHPGTHPMLHHPGQGTPPHQQPGGPAALPPAAQSPTAAQPPAVAQPHAPAPAHGHAQPRSGAQVAAGAVPASALEHVTGEAPVRTSIRTGTHPTGAGTAVGAAGVAATGEEEGGGLLKGLSRFIRRRDTEPTTATRAAGGPRRVRAMLTTVDPWSVTKLGFLLSIAAGITFVVAVNIVWGVLNGMGVFASIEEQVETLFGPETEASITQFLEKDKVMSVAILLAVVNSFLMTGLATIGSILYNLVVKLVGGVYVTLTDE